MALPYRPGVIANERGAYLMTCKKELAESLVAHLNHRSVFAELSDAESTERMEFGDEEETYTVQQIDLNGEYPQGQIEGIITEWVQASG